MVTKSLREASQFIAIFIHYLYTDVMLKPDNIVAHLSAVRHHFRANFQSVSPFEHPSLRACKTALKLRHLALEELTNPDPSKRRLPLSADMLLSLIARYDTREMEGAMMVTALLMGFCMLLRSSEYLYIDDAIRESRSHAFLAKDIEFFTHDGASYTAAQVDQIEWSAVTTVRLTLRHAKNDKFRIGNATWFRAGQHLIGRFDLVEVLFDWAKRAHLQPQALFLSFWNVNTKAFFPLKAWRVRAAVKDCAKAFGFDPAYFGCHSIRVGGASALRAGGAPDSMIQLIGRWQSLPSCLGYQAGSTAEFDRMLGILSNITAFTHKDIRIGLTKPGTLTTVKKLPDY
jgi:hypothetical protein